MKMDNVKIMVKIADNNLIIIRTIKEEEEVDVVEIEVTRTTMEITILLAKYVVSVDTLLLSSTIIMRKNL